MSGRALVLIAVLACVGCEPDRGACLEGHMEARHTPDVVSYIKIGEVDMPIVTPGRDYMLYVCDRWEFPNGKVER